MKISVPSPITEAMKETTMMRTESAYMIDAALSGLSRLKPGRHSGH